MYQAPRPMQRQPRKAGGPSWWLQNTAVPPWLLGTWDGLLKAEPASTVCAGPGLSAQAPPSGSLFSTGVGVEGSSPAGTHGKHHSWLWRGTVTDSGEEPTGSPDVGEGGWRTGTSDRCRGAARGEAGPWRGWSYSVRAGKHYELCAARQCLWGAHCRPGGAAATPTRGQGLPFSGCGRGRAQIWGAGTWRRDA